MLEEKISSIKFNYNDGKFSINGNEDFINKNLNIILEFIKDNHLVKYQNNNNAISNKLNDTNTNKDINKYIEAGIIHMDEKGNISILKQIPNKNNTDKVKNLVLIYLFLKKEKIFSNDNNLINLCQSNDCYNSKTFATILSKEKRNIVKNGKGKKWTIELTAPGRDAAIKLLDDMINANK